MSRRPDLHSDFAQKLLGDIRVRKERLGYASSGKQSSNVSSSFNSGANSRSSFRGAQGTTKNNFHPQSSNNKGLPSPRRKTKQSMLNASSQIVPYRKAQTPSMDSADVPMALALALALSNTGKLQNIEIMSRTKVGSEFVTHLGSIHFSSPNSQFLPNGRASNRNQFLFLPDFGVKKISEMITAYSNGRRRRNSLAMELEESLNMLMMLQDASDHMGASSKNQVLLLKDKEENENGFRSKSSKQNKFNSEKKSLNSYKSSIYSGTSVTTKKENSLSSSTSNKSLMNSNYSNSTRGNSEHSKLRIPNIIARLMGLEDVPEYVKPKVEIKEVEPQEKEEKGEDNMRSSKRENDIPATCNVKPREETRLERITRTYINSKRGIFGKCVLDAQNIPPKKNDDKVHMVRSQKKKEKPNHEVVKHKTVTESKKVVQKVQCMDKDLMKKRSLGNSHHGKVVRDSLINKKKEVDGNIRQAKNNHVLEKGCKIGEKRVQKNKVLTELGMEKGKEAEVKIADLKGDEMRNDDSASSKIVLNQNCSKETDCYEITGMKFDQHQEPQISISGEEQLQLLEEEQTDTCNFSKEPTNLYYEDPLTENQILLRDMLLSDSEFLDLSQALLTNEVNTAKLETITKTPLEKDNNTALLHTAHEILKRKATRLDTCENIKIQSLNSLIRELDSDFKSLGHGTKVENFDSQRIIEREIWGGNPDANCSWEYGWNPNNFAPFEKREVAKELEKHLTSGLITELTRDLVDMIIPV